ncbi:MAG: hypothetical protein ACI97A_000741, partial [Planctomycetota bacterium]
CSPFVLKKKIELTEGQQLKLDFSVPTGAIMGRALDGEGNPLMGAKVTAKRVVEEESTEGMEADRVVSGVSLVMSGEDTDGSSFVSFSNDTGSNSSVVTDEDGYYVIPYLEGGIYNLNCRKSNYASAKIEKLELDAESTLKNIDFTLNAACKLTVRATSQKSGSMFFNVKVEKIKTKNDDAKRKFFQKGGAAKFTSLTPGEYLVTCREGDQKKEEKITIAIGDDQTLTFDF